jgi:hypothetical protein
MEVSCHDREPAFIHRELLRRLIAPALLSNVVLVLGVPDRVRALEKSPAGRDAMCSLP